MKVFDEFFCLYCMCINSFKDSVNSHCVNDYYANVYRYTDSGKYSNISHGKFEFYIACVEEYFVEYFEILLIPYNM